MAQTRKEIAPCGCEFTTFIEGNERCTFLSRCRCQKHYDEQFIAKFGTHTERIENPIPLLPLEKKEVA